MNWLGRENEEKEEEAGREREREEEQLNEGRAEVQRVKYLSTSVTGV